MPKKGAWRHFAVVGTLAAAAGVFALPGAAWALACPRNRVCFYDAQNYSGTNESYDNSFLRAFGCVNLTTTDNKVTSYSNYSNYVFYAYDRPNCAGGSAMFQMPANLSIANVGSTWNDKMSSVQYRG